MQHDGEVEQGLQRSGKSPLNPYTNPYRSVMSHLFTSLLLPNVLEYYREPSVIIIALVQTENLPPRD